MNCGFSPTRSLSRGIATSTKVLPKNLRQKELRDRFLRVDHAGEFAADRIYAGQMAVLGKVIWKQTSIC